MTNDAHLLELALQSVRDAVVIADAAGHVARMNRAAEAMTGWSQAEALGHAIEAVVDLRKTSSEAMLVNPAHAALRLAAKVESEGEVLLVAKNGLRAAVEASAAPLLDSGNHATGAVLVLHDLSEALRMANRSFYLAHHDPLTGLPNRILLVDRMEQATKFADRHSDQMAVFSLDLDCFSRINEAHGHSLADELLKEAASRISETLRESDTVCRLGADDFVLLLPGVTSRSDVESLAAKLIRAIAQPFELGDVIAEVTCTIGIGLYPQDAIDAATLMRLADAAMLRAKHGGKNRYAFARVEAVANG